MMEWIVKNCEWIFSGIGVSILGVIIKIIFYKKKKSPSKHIKTEIHQTNIGSHGTQIGIQQNYYLGGEEDDR